MARINNREHEFASLLSRLAATVVDGLIVSLLYLLGILLLSKLDLSNWLTISCLVFFVFILYFTWPISKYTQTPGYKLMRITVIRADGANLSLSRAFFRHVVKSSFGIISILFYGSNPKRQTLHDIVVDSIVVKEKYN